MTITFEVRKRSDDFFFLNNYCTLNSLSKNMLSNNTTVISHIKKAGLKIMLVLLKSGTFKKASLTNL
jgi:hypothetical protein